MAENMQYQGRDFSPVLFLQINPITEQVRKYYQEMNLSEVIRASGKIKLPKSLHSKTKLNPFPLVIPSSQRELKLLV